MAERSSMAVWRIVVSSWLFACFAIKHCDSKFDVSQSILGTHAKIWLDSMGTVTHQHNAAISMVPAWCYVSKHGQGSQWLFDNTVNGDVVQETNDMWYLVLQKGLGPFGTDIA
jgi:hypothetical protein